MKTFSCGLVLCGLLAAVLVQAAPEPEPAKGLRAVYQDNERPQFRQAAVVEDSEQDDDSLADDGDAADIDLKDVNNGQNKATKSSGRLFLNKLLLFRNLFGSSSSQPVIPIIITGASSSTNTNPTTTVTSTGTVPTATGTITTTPTAKSNSRAGYQNADDDDEDLPLDNDDGEQSDDMANLDSYNDNSNSQVLQAAAADEQALQAALAAGAQEYVVTDGAIRGTADSKMNPQSNRINLRRKNGRKGQVISVRIPPKYRRYFKNGQRVMLNTGNRPQKRRVIRKRVNQGNNRRRVNQQKRKNQKNKNRIISV